MAAGHNMDVGSTGCPHKEISLDFDRISCLSFYEKPECAIEFLENLNSQLPRFFVFFSKLRSKRMGKNLRQQDSHMPLNHGPGCMWGIFQHLHRSKWHSVRKRLPHKRHASAKKSSDQESAGTGPETAEIQENIESAVGSSAKQNVWSVVQHQKTSIKSRLRALITEEMSKRKDRHCRSSSCPIRTQSETGSSSESNPKVELLGCRGRAHSVASLDPLLPKVAEENSSNKNMCKVCATMLNSNYLKRNEVDKVGGEPARDHTLLQDKLIYAVEPDKCASLQESKLFMDALDLLNMRKEVFLKIVQDPTSSLAHQLQCRRMPNLRPGLTKSVSFPAFCSSADRTCNSYSPVTKQEIQDNELHHRMEVMKDVNKHLPTLKGLYKGNGGMEQCSRGIELSGNASPSSANMLRKRQNRSVALSRFKNLREKIKHVIRDRKKESNRIIMDAVHHKVPYGRGVSRDRNDDGHMTPDFNKFSQHSPGSSWSSSQLRSDFNKSPMQRFKRTSSFNESVDRYNRLLEINLNRETKDQISERLRSRTDAPSPIPEKRPTLGRILSLPDLRSYSFIHIDDSPSNSSLHTSDTLAAGNISGGNIGLTEQKPLFHLGSENKIQQYGVLESESQENLLNVGETFGDSADSKTWETASSYDLNFEPVSSSVPQPSEPYQVSRNDSNCQADETGQGLTVSVLEENMTDSDTLESQVKKLYNDLLRVQVDAKNEAEFNYVKDVLELSGFSRDEILGRWHSAEHPVNPAVFVEVEGCLVAQPECSGNEEGGSCDHLLLFDLINEVLLEIYERSFCYWPMPLTSRSRMHQMPKGHRVLEEVWAEISWLLSCRLEFDQAIDDAVSRDLSKHDGWMNLQFDGECVALEVEDLILDDLIEEIIST
ncbi:protein TRM32 [Sesamum angolense]|uniref:Protein TRM32 n=1 Tax=Sesamum angolense TaxID=2727404 RepID=A0AAE1WF28_9LAMI|nr:protein TRM32 [Sesamum angolense]